MSAGGSSFFLLSKSQAFFFFHGGPRPASLSMTFIFEEKTQVAGKTSQRSENAGLASSCFSVAGLGLAVSVRFGPQRLQHESLPVASFSVAMGEEPAASFVRARRRTLSLSLETEPPAFPSATSEEFAAPARAADPRADSSFRAPRCFPPSVFRDVAGCPACCAPYWISSTVQLYRFFFLFPHPLDDHLGFCENPTSS